MTPKPATRCGGGSDEISEPTVQSGWEKESIILVRLCLREFDLPPVVHLAPRVLFAPGFFV